MSDQDEIRLSEVDPSAPTTTPEKATTGGMSVWKVLGICLLVIVVAAFLLVGLIVATCKLH